MGLASGTAGFNIAAAALSQWIYLLTHDWDYKTKNGPVYRDFGNYNFGVVAAAFGFTKLFSEMGAGFFNMMFGHYRKSFGTALTGPPWGEDPKTNRMIKRGFETGKSILSCAGKKPPE